MKMRAAVLEEFGKPLVVQEMELSDPKEGEALVRLVACGVCHTDMYSASGVDPSGYAPTVLGHEGAGVVEAVGPGVKDVEVGDDRRDGRARQAGDPGQVRTAGDAALPQGIDHALAIALPQGGQRTALPPHSARISLTPPPICQGFGAI